jgi:hypothetical protein
LLYHKSRFVNLGENMGQSVSRDRCIATLEVQVEPSAYVPVSA